MAITRGEAVQVLGKAVVNVGKALDDPNTPNAISRDELFAIIQAAIADAMAEFTD